MTQILTSNRRKLPEGNAYSQTWKAFVEGYRGSAFLRDVSQMLAETTGVSYVLIGYPCNAEMTQIRSAVLLANGNFIADYSYQLNGTPCENVVGRSCCYYPSNIQQMFPQDAELKHLSIESYIGLPIPGEDGKPLGLIALMDKKTIRYPAQIEKGLKALSERLAAELSAYLKVNAQQANLN